MLNLIELINPEKENVRVNILSVFVNNAFYIRPINLYADWCDMEVL